MLEVNPVTVAEHVAPETYAQFKSARSVGEDVYEGVVPAPNR